MMAGEERTELNGKRIVVVEDDYLLANDICRELRDLGATVLGPAPTPFYAKHLIGRKVATTMDAVKRRAEETAPARRDEQRR